MAGHCRRGIIVASSQFMSTAKLCTFRRNALVETVPARNTASKCSPCVSIRTRSRIKSNALSLAAVFQRTCVGPVLMAMISSSTFCHVRVATLWVAVAETDSGQTQIHGGLFARFIHRHEQAIGLGLVLGLEAGEGFGSVVKGVINALAAEE
jgi:hypothetical protein